MITQILYLNKMDPSAVIGGKLPLTNSNGLCGNSDILVCESCEFVNTFLELSPDISVLLNIDNDHLDFFKTMENLTESFKKFIAMSKICFVNGDDERSTEAVKTLGLEKHTYGTNKASEYYADNIRPSKYGFAFDVYKNGNLLTKIELAVPGRHNVMNCLAAFAVCHYLGVSPEGIRSAVESFKGAGRRFEFIAEYEDFVLADDYAHHPTEIKATLQAAKDLSYKRVVAVFQPFTFSRTALLKDEFTDALSVADKVILTPIMGSREVNTYGIMSEHIAEGLSDAVCVPDFDAAVKTILDIVKTGDIVITMGGGDIYKVAHMIEKIKGC